MDGGVDRCETGKCVGREMVTVTKVEMVRVVERERGESVVAVNGVGGGSSLLQSFIDWWWR